MTKTSWTSVALAIFGLTACGVSKAPAPASHTTQMRRAWMQTFAFCGTDAARCSMQCGRLFKFDEAWQCGVAGQQATWLGTFAVYHTGCYCLSIVN